jgi:hypothetical protein
MNYTLHKIPEGFIVTSDEIPNVGDTVVESLECQSIKVIAKQYQIDFSSLSEEEQKEIGYFDVDSVVDSILDKEYHNVDLCYSDFKIYEQGYRSAFQKAQELLSDRKFTKGEMKLAFLETDTNRSFEEFIRSLSQTSWKVELEMEYDLESIDSSKKVMRPKLTNGKIKILKLL